MKAVRKIDFSRKVFDIADEPMPRGSWWWWFWLFFFDNPKDPGKPRQLMILWSTKNDGPIDCNGVRISLSKLDDRMRMDGAVAAWYYDGERMHHNLLLEPAVLNVTKDSLFTASEVPTRFEVNDRRSVVTIGDRFRFVSKRTSRHRFADPEHSENTFLGSLGYSLLRMNHFSLTGVVDGKKVEGTSYFQRVFVNAPSVGWYWGTFHFGGGAILKYYNIRALGKSFKKEIKLFDGKTVHEIDDIRVRRVDAKYPDFVVSGENEKERIEFTVDCYSHSSWTFRKNVLGFIPNKLVYNEYPARIRNLRLEDKESGKVLTCEDLGEAVGNAEHTTGFLL
jgi:hypothetical protein